MNAFQPEIIATQRGARSADVTVRAQVLTAYRGTCEQHNRPVRYDHRFGKGVSGVRIIAEPGREAEAG